MTGSSGPSAPPPAAVESAEQSADLQARRRGVLKKDSSYDDTLRPILKNNPERAQSSTDTIPILQGSKLNDSAGALSSTSSEDLENFIDVIFHKLLILSLKNVARGRENGAVCLND